MNRNSGFLRKRCSGLKLARLWGLTICMLILTACGSGGEELFEATAPDGAAAEASADAASEAEAVSDSSDAVWEDSGAKPQGKLSGDFRVNSFGWRPADTKIAVLLDHGGAAVALRRTADNAVVATYTPSPVKLEGKYSGDQYSTVDFSSFTTPGEYYLYLPSADSRSYVFRLAENVYDIVGVAAAKASYFQRCYHDKVLPYAADTLGGFPGKGGQWVDGVCHAGDSKVPPGPGSANNGTLDLHGGWHDAGDYQKTLWERGVPQMLFAYEVNPAVWKDGQSNIPESGNGIPDILDEVKWELDFYLRMQRPDGHFLSALKGQETLTTTVSPPSASNESRFYFDGTSPPEGDGWSGQSVTIARATGNVVLSLAHAAIVFRATGQTATGNGYAAAAASGWNWLAAKSLSGEERSLKAAAAAAVFRMDPAIATAKSFADAFPWDTWDGAIAADTVTPADAALSCGAWHYLLNVS
ncbi:hypothetical protein EPN90_02155, partial [Patescibacteria group bacterium]